MSISWWVMQPQPGIVLWARLTLDDEGRASVLDSSGLTLNYDDEDAARNALLTNDYRAHDGLDEDDARALGATLEELEPPQARDEPTLVRLMTQQTEA